MEIYFYLKKNILQCDFFSKDIFFQLYQSEYHCYSKMFSLFLVWRR